MTDNVTLKAFLRQMVAATASEFPVWSMIAADALDALEAQEAKITEALKAFARLEQRTGGWPQEVCQAHAWLSGDSNPLETVESTDGQEVPEALPSWEVREDESGELDEVICFHPESVHLERMNNCAWWLGIAFPSGATVHVNVGAVNQRAKPYATYWQEVPGE